MTTLIDRARSTPDDIWRDLNAEMTAALPGRIDASPQARALYATDASNYRQPPLCVVTPRSREDVVEAVRISHKHGAPIVARGGGTSLAGQGCNAAVLIDFSRHLNKLVWLDPTRKLACVEPGCILDTLRDAAESHRLTFGPDPATHDHNTLGGMIGNNSCGAHSLMSGRTGDYVERLTILTYDGEILDVGPTGQAELKHITAEPGRRGQMYGDMLALRDRYGGLITARYPNIPRRVSGFENLDALLEGSDFNVAKALTGTEGTCVTILDATVRLIASPSHRALVLLAYDDIFDAADAAPALRESGALAIEAFDGRLKQGAPPQGFPQGGAWLIVETGANTAEGAAAQAQKIARHHASAAGVRVVEDQAACKRVWRIREAALGDAARVPGADDAWPGWEDSAVPPERLGEYLRALDALMTRHDYQAAFYGHFGGGLVHCRLNFDFASESGLSNYRSFMADAARLVTDFGGSLSGEHGDGQARAEFLDIMYGAELVECFARFKAIWDPKGRMNPGKAIEAYPVDANLRFGPDDHAPELRTHFAFEGDNGSFARATRRCVGVGKCRRVRAGEEVMCPSYLATHEEKHSTRGRARLLDEMLRGDVIENRWRSSEVEDALSLCLSCKSCKKDCPVEVDMARYKAEFRAHHYEGRLRPREAYSMGHIHRWARLAQLSPALANAFLHAPLTARFAKWVAGIHAEASTPRFARHSFRHEFAQTNSGGPKVLLWPDTFNDAFSPGVLHAAAHVFAAMGFDVELPARRLCCGRPLYDWGFLDAAKQLWRDTLDCLAPAIAAKTPVVVLEPACASAFKDEGPALMSFDPRAQELAELVKTFDAFVANQGRAAAIMPPSAPRLVIKPHCHQHAVLGIGPEARLARTIAAETEIIGGCCGMAGAFGMASASYDVGHQIGRLTLAPLMDEELETPIIADGFSCRQQITRLTGRAPLHFAEFLARSA